MAKYRIQFFYDGTGEIDIKAKNEKEARELFSQGEWEQKDVNDLSDNFNIQSVEKI